MSTYLIIGGSSGIGEQLAKQLTATGHTVFATYHTHPVSDASIQYHPLNVLEDNIQLNF